MAKRYDSHFNSHEKPNNKTDQSAEKTHMCAEHAANPIDSMVVEYGDSITALPDDMILVVHDMLCGKRSPQAIQVALATFGHKASEAAILAYAEENKEYVDPVDMQARFRGVIRRLEMQTRVIQMQVLQVFNNLSARQKAELKSKKR